MALLLNILIFVFLISKCCYSIRVCFNLVVLQKRYYISLALKALLKVFVALLNKLFYLIIMMEEKSFPGWAAWRWI